MLACLRLERECVTSIPLYLYQLNLGRVSALSSERNEEQEDSQTLEPFLVKGDILSIPNLTISFGDDGNPELQPVTFYTGSHMCPYWLRIAYDHLLATEKNSVALIDAKRRNSNDEMGDALKLEFASGMQAIMASGIAIDAFYASVKEYVSIPLETTKAWRENRKARYKQASEVFRIAFHLDKAEAHELREVIKSIYDSRNRAVHPSPGASALALHPQLNKMTNWRYAAFCFQYAKTIVSFAVQIVCRLAGSPREADYISSDLMNYCKTLLVDVEPLLGMWAGEYGPLIRRTA